jgi:hypothetical protein
LDNASHYHATNTTKPIDSNFDSHIPILPKEVAVAIGEALTISVLPSPGDGISSSTISLSDRLLESKRFVNHAG